MKIPPIKGGKAPQALGECLYRSYPGHWVVVSLCLMFELPLLVWMHFGNGASPPPSFSLRLSGEKMCRRKENATISLYLAYLKNNMETLLQDIRYDVRMLKRCEVPGVNGAIFLSFPRLIASFCV
jgi:hypothetical protein